jgi:hypothetical protein
MTRWKEEEEGVQNWYEGDGKAVTVAGTKKEMEDDGRKWEGEGRRRPEIRKAERQSEDVIGK